MISVFEITQVDAQQKPFGSRSVAFEHGHEGGSFGTVLDGCNTAKDQQWGAQGAAKDAASDVPDAGAKPAQQRVEPDEHGAKQIETNGNPAHGEKASDGNAQSAVPDGAVSPKDAGVLKEAGKKLQARFPGGFAVLTGGRVCAFTPVDGEKVKDSAKNPGEAKTSTENSSEAAPVAQRDTATTEKEAKTAEKGAGDAPVPVQPVQIVVAPVPCAAVVINSANTDSTTPVAKDAGAQDKDSEAAIDVLRSGGSTDAARAITGARAVQGLAQAAPAEAVKETGNDNDADDVKVQDEVPSTDASAKAADKKTPGFLDSPSHDEPKADAATLFKDVNETGNNPAKARPQQDSAEQPSADGTGGAGMSGANAKDAISKTTRAGFFTLAAPQGDGNGKNIVTQADGTGRSTPVAAAPGMNAVSNGLSDRKDPEGERKGAGQGTVPLKGTDNTVTVAGIKTQFGQDTAEAASAQHTAHASALYEKVTDGVRMCVSAAGKEISLQLSPEHLGNLHIRITGGEDGGSVSAKITVENASIKTILDSDAGRLKEIFGSQGLTLDRYTVDISQNGASFGNFAGAPFGGNGKYFGHAGADGTPQAQVSEAEHKPLYTPAAPYGAMAAKGVDLFA